MGYKVEKLPGEPIVVYTQLPGGNPADEIPFSIAESVRVLDAQIEPVFLVNDMRGYRLSVEQILQGALTVGSGKNALLHHPMIRENVFVATGAVLKTAINGLSGVTFGQVQLVRFDTIEEAMAYCREKISVEG